VGIKLDSVFMDKWLCALVSVKENEEANSKSEKGTPKAEHTPISWEFSKENETIKSIGGTKNDKYPTMDVIWFSNVVRTGDQSRSRFQSQFEP
jgi:hypothetical protein